MLNDISDSVDCVQHGLVLSSYGMEVIRISNVGGQRS